MKVSAVETVRQFRSRIWLRYAVALAVTVVLLYLVLRAIQPGSLGAILRHTSVSLLPIAALGALAFIGARAWRYQLLLGPGRVHAPGTLFLITLSSWGASLVLPGILGDGTFVWLARTQLGVPITLGTGAAVLSRLLDVGSLVLIALLTAPLAGVVLPGGALLAGLGLALVVILLLAVVLWHRPRSAIIAGLTPLPWVGSLLTRVRPAIEELGGGSRPAQLVLATLAARLATAVQYLVLFAAIHRPLGFWQVWFALSIRTLLYAVPIQGIGGLGTSQVWWTAALRLLGRPFGPALAASLAVHLVDLAVSVPLAAAGAVALLAVRRRRRVS